MQSRPKFEGDTAANLRHVLLPGIEHTIAVLEDFLKYEHNTLLARNLSGGLRELAKARASIGLAAVAAGQLEGN